MATPKPTSIRPPEDQSRCEDAPAPPGAMAPDTCDDAAESAAQPARSPGWGIAEAVRFLFPPARSRTSGNATAWSRAVIWIIPLGLLVGLLWTGAFRLTWRLYGETANMRVIPALTVVLVECLLTGPFLAMGLARTAQLLAGTRPTQAAASEASWSSVGTLVLCLVVLAQWVLIVSIPSVTGWWPSQADWRHYFNFLYPRPILRPLLLAPLWGRWGILLAATIGRTAPGVDAATVALCKAMGPARLLRQTTVPMVLTAVYFSRQGNFLIGISMGTLVFGVTYIACVVMARRGGGQTRRSIFAGGQIAQLAFLAVYRALWPAIHG